MITGDLPLFSQNSPKKELEDLTTTAKSRPLTISQLTSQIRNTLEPEFMDVWVQGEISNYRPAASGHIYFSLKDSTASIATAIFGWGLRSKQRPRFEVKDGLQVLCHGKLSVYPPRGTYQLVVDQIEPLGAGALQLAFEQLKAKLQAEGLFDPERKRPLPRYPKKVVVMTSPTGAAVKDIVTVIQRRAPNVEIVIVPAVVQGDGAAEQIITAIERANTQNLGDVMIVGRGGGSIEDLWCFNDENLARVIVGSEIPIISAVGHEIDFTIADFVADLRAPTPSAAAEIVTAHWVDFAQKLADFTRRLAEAIRRTVVQKKLLLEHVSARLKHPRDQIREQAQRCDELSERLDRAMHQYLDKRRSRLEQFMGKLDALSPLRVLDRGYTIVRDQDESGRVIKSAQELKPDQKLELTFVDGTRQVRVL